MQWSARRRARGCQRIVRRKRSEPTRLASAAESTVELHDAGRPGGRLGGEEDRIEHRDKVHHSPGSPGARGTSSSGRPFECPGVGGDQRSAQVGRAMADSYDPKVFLRFTTVNNLSGPLYKSSGSKGPSPRHRGARAAAAAGVQARVWRVGFTGTLALAHDADTRDIHWSQVGYM